MQDGDYYLVYVTFDDFRPDMIIGSYMMKGKPKIDGDVDFNALKIYRVTNEHHILAEENEAEWYDYEAEYTVETFELNTEEIVKQIVMESI